MAWDSVEGTSDYELQMQVSDPLTGARTLTEGVIVTHPQQFHTARSRTEFRVRGRKQDAELCGPGAGGYCYTGWTGWFSVAYTPRVRIAAPETVTTPTSPTTGVGPVIWHIPL